MILKMNLPLSSYDIVIEQGSLDNIDKYLNLNRKVLVVTDSMVPVEYASKVTSKAKNAILHVIKAGEESKSLETYQTLLKVMLDNNFSRKDCVIAVGGGVVGDLAGFVASSYMRGVDFYNIPTTTLSQIDSSIGGKTGVNFNGVKNIVGAFYQPKKVVIDINVLKTLTKRQFNSGLVEALKMSMTSNPKLFELFEKGEIESNIETIIIESLKIKKDVVEQDEKESGLRKILNLGHTIGHGIEANLEGKLYHGECVGVGLIPMCSDDIKPRLIKILNKLDIPTEVDLSLNDVMNPLRHDKKANNDSVSIVRIEEIGKYILEDVSFTYLEDKVREVLKEER